MAIFKKMSLKSDDKKRTKAAELTLRQSIYPLCLVTILFFLWVSSPSRCIELGGQELIKCRGSHTDFLTR